MVEKYAVADTETNGLFDFSKPADAEGQPRLAHLAMIVLRERAQWAKVNVYIRPDGWRMTPETTAINGLTDDKLDEFGVPVRDALEIYCHLVDRGHVVVAYNADFDLKVLRGELRRAGMDDRYSKTPSICTMRPCTDICKIPKANGRGYKFPILAEAMRPFGLEQRDAHRALGDAQACLELFLHLRRSSRR